MDHLKPTFQISTMRTMELGLSVGCVLVATVCAGSYQQIYTFCNSLGSSVIDYVLTNDNKFVCISFFKVARFDEWSFHAPVTFELCL